MSLSSNFLFSQVSTGKIFLAQVLVKILLLLQPWVEKLHISLCTCKHILYSVSYSFALESEPFSGNRSTNQVNLSAN